MGCGLTSATATKEALVQKAKERAERESLLAGLAQYEDAFPHIHAICEDLRGKIWEAT